MHKIGLALVLACLPGASVAAGAQEAPDLKRQRVLVDEFLELDGRSREGIGRQDEILAELARVAPLDERGLKDWTKWIDKRLAKAPALEKKSGRHYLWEEGDEERGLYIVGGDTRKPKGLFIGLHGGGAGSGDAGSAQSAFGSAASDNDWVAIFPEVLVKTEHGWTDSGTEEFVLELIERAFRTWKLDRDHVFLGGHSMGGYGTWTLGARYADLFAALTPSAGAPTPIRGPTGIEDVGPCVIPNLRNVPIVIYQSDNDPQVPPEPNRAAAKMLGEARERWGGFDFEYWEVPGRGHGLPPGGTTALLEKVADRVRDPRPTKVVWQPFQPWKRQFYWLWWERPVKESIVEAELDREANRIRVSSAGGYRGMWVLVDDQLLDLERELVVEAGGEEVFRGTPAATLAAFLSTAVHGDAARTYPIRIPLEH